MAAPLRCDRGGILTILCQGMVMRCVFAISLSLVLVACSANPAERADTSPLMIDPVVARALHDPLMSDPDLSARNDANAVLGLPASGALPAFAATPDAARAAREAARLELLEGGPISDLPPVSEAVGGKSLGTLASAADLLSALGVPQTCGARLEQGFVWSANLPPVAAIMPHGMVIQAGGAEIAPCRLRIIRYQTPAMPADVLAYHYARAVRAGLTGTRTAVPEAMIDASSPVGQRLVVQVRPAAHGMTAVDLLYRAP